MEKKNLKALNDAELEQVAGGRGAGSKCASISSADACIEAGCCWYENVACVEPSNVIRGME